MSRLDQLLQFRAEDPDDSFIRFALASEYRKLGQADKALDEFNCLRQHDPDYVGLYYHLGKLYEQLGNLDHAMDVYREGIKRASAGRDLHARAELQSALMEAEMSDE